MRRFCFVYIVGFIFLCATSCSHKAELEAALEQAGANRAELEKVLRHYKDDTLKYRAACFLIENMPYHSYKEGKALEQYRKYFSLYSKGDYKPQQLVDSLKQADGAFSESSLVRKRDIEEVDSAFLVYHIDWAFKVWREQPWGKHVSFDDFCEYILPYRVGDEPLAEWRDALYAEYNPLLDSLRASACADDPLAAARVIMTAWRKKAYKWTFVFPSGPHVGPQIVEWKCGSCREYTDGISYLFRALGIPAGTDKLLMRGNGNAPHSWGFTFDKAGNTYITEPVMWAKAEEQTALKAKVERVTYSLNRELVSRIADIRSVYPSFRLPMFKDVTRLYSVHPVRLQIGREDMYREVEEDEPVYLCVAEHLRWIPVDITYSQGGKVTFADIDGGIVAILATGKGERLELLTDPFFIAKETGRLSFYRVQPEKERVRLYAKYGLGEDMGDFVHRMAGGVIEGSNCRDFSDADTLYFIEEPPYRLFTTVRPRVMKPYRYIRYRGGRGSYSDIGELSLYGNVNDSVPLSGKVIGTPGCYDNDGSHEYTNVFDGDPFTSFNYKSAEGGWAGLDLGCPHQVEKIVYVPRNRGNFVRPGQCFELFYFDKGGWHSLGRRIADSDVLEYEVPKGALLYLKNHTEGQDERIFEIKDGKQVFW